MQWIDIFVKSSHDDRMAIGLLALLILLALAILMVARGRAWGPSAAEKFLSAWGLAVTASTVSLSRRQLERDVWFRRLGAWSGFFVATGWKIVTRDKLVVDVSTLAVVLAGSSLGVVWSARPPRRQTGSVRSAALRPRDVADYRSEGTQRLEWGAAGLVLVTAVAVALVAWQRELGSGIVIRAALPVLLGVIVTPAVRRLQRRVVEHPQPARDTDLLAVDDAHRASTVQSLHHALVGLQLCLAILAIGALPSNGLASWVQWSSVVVVVVLLGGALAQWRRVAQAPFGAPLRPIGARVGESVHSVADDPAEAP